MSKLFSPLTIREITFRNRIAISPMCQYSAENGLASDWHLVHLGSRAVGGAGLIIQEATAVSPEGRISPADLGLYDDNHVDMLKRINSFIHDHGSVAGVQLAHAGRKASTAIPLNGGKQIDEKNSGWTTVAPFPVSFLPDDNPPAELDQKGIEKVIKDFRDAAFRALKAGFKVIEIHAAHGYLIHQFLSPLSNRRTDNYGGNFENRIKLLVETVNAVKEVWPDNYPLFVRISVTDWVENGWNESEAIKLSSILKKSGVDLIDCSSGGIVPGAKIPVGPGYQVGFAERIKRETKIMTGAVGLITDPKQAEEILNGDRADMIIIGRASLRDPHFPLHAASALGEDIAWPLQYQRAKM